MRRAVSLYLPTWATDRARRTSGGPPGDVPLVTAARERGRRVVFAADGEARRLGLRPGVALAAAAARVPNLAVADADAQGDAEALDRLAAWAFRRYSPLVAADPPDGLILDITGCAHLFGGEAALLGDLIARLARHGVAARGSIADTPGAAHALARYGARDAEIVPVGAARDALAGLPVVALRLTPETAAELERVGLRTIGDLLGTPRAPLARRFGLTALRRLDEALGAVREPLNAVLPEDAPRQRLSFAEPLVTHDALAHAAAKLTSGLCRELEARGQGARRLDLVLHRVDGAALPLRIGTARPNRNAAQLVRLFSERLSSFDAGFGVEALVLVATVTEPFAPSQADILPDRDHAEAAGLAPLIDTILNRPGEARLYRLAPAESDLPERAALRTGPLELSRGAWPLHWPRPARLLAPPEPVSAVALLPDYAPRLFVWRGVRHQVRQADGPERVFGEWWRADGEAGEVRDYYQVEDMDGRRFWLFRRTRGEESRWFLHGVFS